MLNIGDTLHIYIIVFLLVERVVWMISIMWRLWKLISLFFGISVIFASLTAKLSYYACFFSLFSVCQLYRPLNIKWEIIVNYELESVEVVMAHLFMEFNNMENINQNYCSCGKNLNWGHPKTKHNFFPLHHSVWFTVPNSNQWNRCLGYNIFFTQ